jgi:hypothetical protein
LELFGELGELSPGGGGWRGRAAQTLDSINSDTILSYSESNPKVTKAVEKRLADIRSNPKSVKFSDALAVAEHYFGEPRVSGSSHHVFKMPWAGDPRINLQKDGSSAKAYQVRQLLAAIDRLTALKAGEME